MKHVTYGEKSLLVGDEVSDLLINYAALLGAQGRTNVVTVHAIGSDGNEVDASFLLNAATELMVETASTTATEPENHLSTGYLLERIEEVGGSFLPH
ncbi:hypothetical protein ABCS02_28290 [Microbacterium sp. X-17]|uniref:hypothetical protein n=1 Tax=Microbacterium sp. X-17 TaxID=3144404 RepID=UPI0031F54B7E